VASCESKPFCVEKVGVFHSDFGSVQWANEQLKFAIRELRAGHLKGDFEWKNCLQLVLYVRDRLWAMRYTWQCRIIDFWIHKYTQRRHLARRPG